MPSIVLNGVEVINENGGAVTLGVPGTIIQTKQTLYRTTVSFNHNSGNYTEISGFNVTTNALMDNVQFYISYDVSAGVSTSNDHALSASVFKDSESAPLGGFTNSTQPAGQKPSHGHSPGYLNNSTANQYRMFLMRGSLLYTSTLNKNASITFKIKVFQHDANSESAYVNMMASEVNDVWTPRSVSQLTVQQISV